MRERGGMGRPDRGYPIRFQHDEPPPRRRAPPLGQPAGPYPGRRPRPPGRLGGRARAAGLSGGPDPAAALAGAGGGLDRGHRAAAGPPGRAGRRVPAAPAGRGSRAAVGRWHPEVPLAAGGRRGHRIGADSLRRPPDALHQLPGRVRAQAAPSAPPGRWATGGTSAPFEIAGQVREIVLRDPADLPTNIVFMGMGEPLLNWPAVDTALTILNAPDGLRHRRAAHHRVHRRHPAGDAGASPGGRSSSASPSRCMRRRRRSAWASCRSRRNTIWRRCSPPRRRSGSGSPSST